MDRSAASKLFEAMELSPSDRLLDTFLSMYRQLEPKGLDMAQGIKQCVVAELSLRKLDVQFDYDRFLRHTVLNGDSSVKHQEKKRGEYFAKFEMAKKVLGLELNVDTLLRDRATLLFDPSVCAQADAARLLFEQRLHHTAHKNNAHHLAAALLLVVGIAKMEELRALLDLAKLDAASARKLAIAIRAALPNGTADKGGEAAQAISSGAGVTTSAAPSPSRKKPRLGLKVEASAERLRSEASLRPSLAVPSAPEIISFSPVDHYGWSASFPVPVQEEGNFSLPHHDLSRRAYEVWRQQILR